MRDANGPEPEVDGRAGLEMRGTMSDPIRDVQDVTLRLWATGTTRLVPTAPRISAMSRTRGRRSV